MKSLVSLMYHDVFNESVTESGFQNIGAIKYKLRRQPFEAQIKTIASYCEEQFVNKENICLTFDDGGKSFLTVIAPILERYGFKGYFFITTKLINTYGFLTTDDIAELDQRGHIVGVHSHTHPANISALSVREIEYEWIESVNILRNILNKRVEYASIPGGFFCSNSEKSLFSNGVNVIFTSNPTTSVRYVGKKMIVGRYAVIQGMATKVVVNILKPFSIFRMMQSIKWKMMKTLKLIFGKNYFKIRNNLLNTKMPL